MKKVITFIFIVFPLLSFGQCDYPDYDVLKSLYLSTNGENWNNNDGWRDGINGNDCEVCNWYGITCEFGSITEIILADNNLYGILPYDFAGFAQLKKIDFSNNQIYGQLPDKLDLPKLEILNLSQNKFYQYWNGHNPPNNPQYDFSTLNSLKELDLSNNEFDGVISPFIDSLKYSLERLILSNNSFFSGIGQLDLNEFDQLAEINCSNNDMGRCLGNNLDKICEVEYDFTGNENMPWFGDLSNYCNGENVIGAPCYNSYFDEISPTIVDQICSCKGQTKRQNSRFADSLILVDIFNKLNGSNWNISWNFADPLTEWPNICLGPDNRYVSRINLGYANGWCSSNGNYSTVTGVKGDFPTEVIGLINIETINFSGNDITGEIPIELGNLQFLRDLSLGDCNMVGSIPEELKNCARLSDLRLYNNSFSGLFPFELLSLQYIRTIDISGNNINGVFQNFCSVLSTIESLNLANNNISGFIPETIKNLPRVNNLNLSFNNISGAFPKELSFINLRNANFSFNNFSGCWPYELRKMCVRVGQAYPNADFLFAGNSGLPWQGDFSKFCNGEEQVGAPCDDGNPNTIDDQIIENCICQGTPVACDLDCKTVSDPLNFDTDAIFIMLQVPDVHDLSEFINGDNTDCSFSFQKDSLVDQISFDCSDLKGANQVIDSVWIYDMNTSDSCLTEYLIIKEGGFCNCDEPNPFAVSSCDLIQDVDIICDLNAFSYICALMPFQNSPGNQPVPLCQNSNNNDEEAQNISWFAFVAYGGDYSITVTPTACVGGTTGELGLQMGLYTDCSFSESVFCDTECNTNPVWFDSSILEEGHTYYIFIDGCSGSICSYEVTITGTPIAPSLTPDCVAIDNNGILDCVDATYCADAAVDFVAIELELTVDYTWTVNAISGGPYIGDANPMTENELLSLTFPEEGVYEICLTQVDNGCGAQQWNGNICRQVTIEGIPDEEFSNQVLCTGQLASFDISVFDSEDPNGDGVSGWQGPTNNFVFGENSATITTPDGCFYTQFLFIEENVPPLNDDPCINDDNPPLDLTGSGSHTGTTCCARGPKDENSDGSIADFGNIDCSGATEDAAVWYMYTPSPGVDGYNIILGPGGADPSEGPIAVEVYAGVPDQGCNGGFGQTLSSSCGDVGNADIKIGNCLAPGEVLFVKVSTDDSDANCGDFVITIIPATCGPMADECIDLAMVTPIEPITNPDFSHDYYCVSGCLDYACPEESSNGGCSDMTQMPTVWFQVTADDIAEQMITSVETMGDWTPIWSVYSGPDCDNLSVVNFGGSPPCSNGDNTPNLHQTSVFDDEENYWIAITVDPGSIPPGGIDDGGFELCVATTPELELMVTFTPTYVCEGDCTDIITDVVGGIGAPYTYIWSTGESTPSINICPLVPTTYFVTVEDALGYMDIGEVQVDVKPLVEITLPESIDVCKDDSFDTNNPDYIVCLDIISGSAPYGVNWNAPQGMVGQPSGEYGECFIINELASSELEGDLGVGIYTLSVSVDDFFGCNVETGMIVNVMEGNEIEITGTPAVCIGEEATITITNAGDYVSFVWTPDIGNAGSVTFIPDSTFTYFVEATAANGCVTQEMWTVESIQLIAGPVVLCSPTDSSVVFSWEELPNVSEYDIVILSQDVDGMPHEGSLDGTTYTINNLNGGETVTISIAAITDDVCQRSETIEYSCTAQDCLAPEVTLESETVFCPQDDPFTINVDILNEEAGTGEFSGSGIVNPTEGIFDPSQAEIGQNVITYVFYADNGCIGNTTIGIQILAPENDDCKLETEIEGLVLTDIISPDGDGVNDVLRFNTEDVIPDSELWIYNRWGNQIFHQENYTNDWNASGYPGGVYFYVLFAKGQEIKKTLTVLK